MLCYLQRILSDLFLPSHVIKLHVFQRIPSHISWHWAIYIAEVNPISAFLALGYSRHESPHSFLGTGLQQRQIPSQLSWHWGTADTNPLSFPGTGLQQRQIPSQLSWHWPIAEVNPLSGFFALSYCRGESPLNFPRTELQQRRIPSKFSSHWATAEANPL